MRRFTLLAVMLMIVIASALPARAEIRVGEYEKLQGDSLNLYISGVGVGYLWANAMIKKSGQPLLYCQPREFTATGETYKNILDKEISANKDMYTLDIPIELILLRGLQKTFPCEGK
jgi:hypothetical protein